MVGFNTQPPEGGCHGFSRTRLHVLVSTHSHPKVAARPYRTGAPLRPCFNTQPPEGGCYRPRTTWLYPYRFNTQPPEGGCKRLCPDRKSWRCFNTQPPEGGCIQPLFVTGKRDVSTHSHPKVAAHLAQRYRSRQTAFQHTATRRWLHRYRSNPNPDCGVVSTHSHPKVAAA